MAERTGSRLKRGDVGRRHLFAASQTVNFPGTSDCPASNTQSEIALLPVLPSFLPSFLASVRSAFFLANHVSSNSKGGGGDKADCSPPPGVKFFPRGCDGGGLMTYQTGK